MPLPDIKEDAKPEEIEDDWFAHFFEKCKRISNEEMQILWSKLLAGEANKPGTFSKRTVEIISNQENEIYKNKGITFDTLNHLDTIGLIRYSGAFGLSQTNLPQFCEVAYFENQIILEFIRPSDHNGASFYFPI